MKKLYIFFALLCFSTLGVYTPIYADQNEKAWLGIAITKSKQKESSTSVMIKEVEAGSPAEEAGIKKGDLINSINNKKTKSPIHFIRTMNVFSSGDKIEIELIRDNKYLTKTVTLSSKKIVLKKPIEKKEYTLGTYGITTFAKKNIKMDYYPKKITNKYLFSDPKNETLIITCLKKGSGAEKAGIKLYDEIINVDDKDIKDTTSLNFAEKRNVHIKLLRNGKLVELNVIPDYYKDFETLPYMCVDEYKEYECSNFIVISEDLRPDDYWEKIFNCLDKKNALTIPFGDLLYNFNWIKVKSLAKTINLYASKESRSVEKLYDYMPKGVKVLDEIDDYLKKTNQTKLPYEYKELRRYMVYAYKYAQVKGLKNADELKLSDEIIEKYKSSILNVLKKKELFRDDQRLFVESYEPLLEYGEFSFIKLNWEKAIQLIDWKSIGGIHLSSFKIFQNLAEIYGNENNKIKYIEIIDDGRKKLEEWGKLNPISTEYVIYKRRLLMNSYYQKIFYYTSQSNLKKIGKTVGELEKEIDYFHSLPKLIKKDIQQHYSRHLSFIYTALVSGYTFLQQEKKMIKAAKKALDEINKYANDKNKHLFIGAYYQIILSHLMGGNWDEVVFYFNQFKNVSVEVLYSPQGEREVGTYSSLLLPMLVTNGFYYESEDLIKFVENNIKLNDKTPYEIMQKDGFNYAAGRLYMEKNNYQKSILYLESVSKIFLDNPSSDTTYFYSAIASQTLLEAYYLNGDINKYEKQFKILTGNKPINYSSFSTPLPQKYYLIPQEVSLATAYTVFDYINKKGKRLTDNDRREFVESADNILKNYRPGEEYKIGILKNLVRISSIFSSNNYEEGKKVLLKIIPDIKEEYSNAIFSSNLAPTLRVDDIVQGYLDASYNFKDPKFFEKSYRIAQIVSNSITTRDVKKSLQKRKYKDKKKANLIYEYQKLQIERDSILSGDQFSISTITQTKDFDKSKIISSDRSKEVNNKIKKLEKKIKVEVPTYFNLVRPTGASIKEIQKKLNTNQAFVEFFFFEKNFYTVVIKKNDYKLFKSNTSLNKLETKAQLIKSSISINSSGELEKFDVNNAYEIYNEIFVPIENFINGISEVVVIPNKFLKNIPLHLLPITNAKNCMDCSKINWLMNKYDFAYLPNAEFFAFQDKKKIKITKLLPEKLKEKAKKLAKIIKKESIDYIFLGIGDPNLGNNQQIDARLVAKEIDKITKLLSRGSFITDTNEIKKIYDPVEGSREELNTIKDYLKPSKSLLLLSDEANEIKIKNMDLSKFVIIHFATHGELAGSIKGQNEPFLVLSPPNSGTIENDGILTMSEIMNLDNNAALVILSACNTAGEDIKRSEGFSGLARAFLYSGSKSVLVSNWIVETYAAKELTTGLIKKMKNNSNISTANALSGSMKNFILNNKDKSHPFFWAPFVIVGINAEINL